MYRQCTGAVKSTTPGWSEPIEKNALMCSINWTHRLVFETKFLLRGASNKYNVPILCITTQQTKYIIIYHIGSFYWMPHYRCICRMHRYQHIQSLNWASMHYIHWNPMVRLSELHRENYLKNYHCGASFKTCPLSLHQKWQRTVKNHLVI
jgi:hypothetical protein